MQSTRHLRAVFQALLVTFLWSTSWILIKWGLSEIPALMFAGLRYGLAFVILLPGLWRHRKEVSSLSLADWGWLALLGIFLYALTQGAQFLTLRQLDAIPFSLVLSFTPLLVACASAITLKERLRPMQWGGLAAMLGGAALYFCFEGGVLGSALGFLFAGITLTAGTIASLLGRAVNRRKLASPIVITGISMGIGAVLLLVGGLLSGGVPRLALSNWGIIGWLAAVNTAFAFTLWNHSLRALTATESSVVNNTMLIQIAILAWIFLGESPSSVQILGLALVASGAWLVQRRRARATQR